MMERALKERIIGAVVLVVFAVLVVPVFLDGRPDGGKIISKDVLLPGHEGEGRKTVILDRIRSRPIPVASQEEAVAKPEVSKPAANTVVERTAASKSTRAKKKSSSPPRATAKAAASTTGMWAVQLGSFSNKANAEKLAADLRKQGYAAFLSRLTTDSGQLHRVRIGPQKDRASAEVMAARLLKAGHTGQVVPHP